MSSTDTNGGHQVKSHLGIVQLCVPSELTTGTEYPYVITSVSTAASHDSCETPRVKS